MRRRQRLFDLAAASFGCALFAAPVAVIAVAIKVEDGGPILFRQERVGLGRKPFTIHKLRTMRDGRVTRVGRWLRATGLDETVQFVDVLRGEMRMVGPRPLTPDDIERFGYAGPDSDARFAVRPGITGLAQVYGGRTVRASRRYDALYVRRSSLRLDAELVAVSFAINVIGKARVRRLLSRGRRYARGVTSSAA